MRFVFDELLHEVRDDVYYMHCFNAAEMLVIDELWTVIRDNTLTHAFQQMKRAMEVTDETRINDWMTSPNHIPNRREHEDNAEVSKDNE